MENSYAQVNISFTNPRPEWVINRDHKFSRDGLGKKRNRELRRVPTPVLYLCCPCGGKEKLSTLYFACEEFGTVKM